MTPTPPVDTGATPTRTPASVGFGPAVAVRVNLLWTATDTLTRTDTLRVSVAVTVAVKRPVAGYVWVVEQRLPVVVSPKSQLQVTVPAPPVVGAMKSTRAPTSVRLGLALAVTASFALTVTEMLVVAVTLTVSVAVTPAVNVPWLA